MGQPSRTDVHLVGGHCLVVVLIPQRKKLVVRNLFVLSHIGFVNHVLQGSQGDIVSQEIFEIAHCNGTRVIAVDAIKGLGEPFCRLRSQLAKLLKCKSIRLL